MAAARSINCSNAIPDGAVLHLHLRPGQPAAEPTGLAALRLCVGQAAILLHPPLPLLVSQQGCRRGCPIHLSSIVIIPAPSPASQLCRRHFSSIVGTSAPSLASQLHLWHLSSIAGISALSSAPQLHHQRLSPSSLIPVTALSLSFCRLSFADSTDHACAAAV